MQHKKDKWSKAIDLLCYWNLVLVQGQNWSKVKDFSHVKVSAEYWIMKQNKIIVRHTTWSSFSQKKTWRRDDIWDMNQCETVVSWLFLLANCDALWAFFPQEANPRPPWHLKANQTWVCWLLRRNAIKLLGWGSACQTSHVENPSGTRRDKDLQSGTFMTSGVFDIEGMVWQGGSK